ncbi:MAG: hypothetical protein NWQ98_01380 [Schleiferiaceae bacterium]|nr:hypothetical protein [Schleiferiaceae bacterium]
MNRLLSIIAAGTLLTSCEQGVYCTMEFRSIGFTWTDPAMPDSVSVTSIRTGAQIQILSEPFNQFIPVVDDGSMNQLSSSGDSLEVLIFNDQDSIISTAWYVVGKDECHIIFKSGPEFLP